MGVKRRYIIDEELLKKYIKEYKSLPRFAKALGVKSYNSFQQQIASGKIIQSTARKLHEFDPALVIATHEYVKISGNVHILEYEGFVEESEGNGEETKGNNN